MHIGVWRSLVARLNGVQEAASSNLVTPTIAEPPILGQEKESASWRALSALMIALLLLFRQVDFCNISLFSVPKFKIVISIDIRARNLKDKHYLFFKSRA